MIRALCAFLILAALVLCSCGGDSEVLPKVTAGVQAYTLYAGQHTAVGEIQVWDDATTLYVSYHLYTDSWALTETHLHVAAGDSADGVPQKKGNPIPGKFDYKTDHNYVTDFTYTIPLADIGVSSGEDVSIAAHASVVAATDAVVNGSFEAPEMPSPLGIVQGPEWDRFSSEDIPGWDVQNVTGPDPGTEGNLEYWRNSGAYLGRPDGYQIVEMDSYGHDYGDKLRISQNLTGLTGNCSLSFYWRPLTERMVGDAYDCQIVVNFNGTEFGPFNPSNFDGNSIGGYWDHEVFPLDTSGIDAAMFFIEENGFHYAYGDAGTLLDAVSVLCYGDGETAWSAGVPFSGANWATFSVYTIGSGDA